MVWIYDTQLETALIMVIKTLKGLDKNNEVLDSYARNKSLLGEAMITTCAVRKVMLLYGKIIVAI